MLQTIPVEQAVGMVLPHDITVIIKDVKKGTAFKKGHIIQTSDIDLLKQLGKDNIYVLHLGENDIHENEAAILLAGSLAGVGVIFPPTPQEGKITLYAEYDGLLRVNKDALLAFNMLGEVMCSTLHNYTPVHKGEIVAGTRLIPLIGDRKLVETAQNLAADAGSIVSVHPLLSKKIGLVITGNEVFYGRIEDRFEEVLREKALGYGSTVQTVKKAPDNKESIAAEISACIAEECDLIITSGGMSVDPDDVTKEGIIAAGATTAVYGTPVLPGAMFLSGMIRDIPVLGLPACGMYHKITVFDLVFPRILTGEAIGRKELAELGHGGLCRNCKVCHYPVCNFGK
ncbi:molybdopterin-binding protein [Desulforhopalus sp. IMCC35007]|uniref:molybdopterin-binding protein n=1 Tax=Desulforhopalus sp. IMCC35007 TaxID=2569543 RepID=UPI0010ADC2D2|nr:molybdopterin-binding protein [Desulforhopalus sp. IMCC35007]TKB11111.1 molybdopterin-binding protein [Desulforhopalus sp. IMCC35007]